MFKRKYSVALILLILFSKSTIAIINSPIINSPLTSSPNICVFSIPKTGTHLIMRCIELLTDYKALDNDLRVKAITSIKNGVIPETPPGTFLVTHAPYNNLAAKDLLKKGYKGIFISRDPRDQIVSYAFWLKKLNQRSFNLDISSPTYMSDVLERLIPLTSNEHKQFLPWKNHPVMLHITFEQLIGSKGGGDDALQRHTIKRIAKHLNISLTEQHLNYCINNLFGNTDTFRSGKIGEWKKFFTPEYKALYKKSLGKLLIKLGYEDNLDW